MGERKQFLLPDVGEGLTEAEILQWRVEPGDRVEVNQVLVEIETAKAAVELPCPYAGTVAEVLVDAGELVPVGTPIITLELAAGEAAVGEAAAGEPAAGETQREPVLVGYGVRPTEDQPRRRPRVITDPATGGTVRVAGGPAGDPHGTTRRETGPPGEAAKPMRMGGLEVGRVIEERLATGAEVLADQAAAGAAAAEPGPGSPPGTVAAAGRARTPSRGPVRAKPPVRRLARELGVDLAAVDATGPHGDVTREDVQRAARIRSDLGAAAPVPRDADGVARREERQVIRGVQRAMAEAMVRSAFTAPHVTEWVDVDVSRSVALLQRLKAHPDLAGIRVTPLTLVAAGLLRAVRRHPRVNARWDEAAGQIVVFGYVHLGIAAATPRGLLVPHVRDADQLTLPALAAALEEVVDRARAGTLTPADTTGGTITITNVGVFGVDGGTPILNPGEAAILAMGRILDRPWVVDGAVVARPVMQLSLSFDHRLVDGALGSQVLRDVADFLADPELALALG